MDKDTAKIVEELCVALERTGTIARELMFTALLKDSQINNQLDANTKVIDDAVALVAGS